MFPHTNREMCDKMWHPPPHRFQPDDLRALQRWDSSSRGILEHFWDCCGPHSRNFGVWQVVWRQTLRDDHFQRTVRLKYFSGSFLLKWKFDFPMRMIQLHIRLQWATGHTSMQPYNIICVLMLNNIGQQMNDFSWKIEITFCFKT